MTLMDFIITLNKYKDRCAEVSCDFGASGDMAESNSYDNEAADVDKLIQHIQTEFRLQTQLNSFTFANEVYPSLSVEQRALLKRAIQVQCEAQRIQKEQIEKQLAELSTMQFYLVFASEERN